MLLFKKKEDILRYKILFMYLFICSSIFNKVDFSKYNSFICIVFVFVFLSACVIYDLRKTCNFIRNKDLQKKKFAMCLHKSKSVKFMNIYLIF